MIGLLVNDDGFPISYQVFEGNKFEGHTLMPSILAIKKKYKIEEMTVVADVAMISDDNVFFLKSNNLNYIVGARIANLSISDIKKISKELNLKDEESWFVTLVCSSRENIIRNFDIKKSDLPSFFDPKDFSYVQIYIKDYDIQIITYDTEDSGNKTAQMDIILKDLNVYYNVEKKSPIRGSLMSIDYTPR